MGYHGVSGVLARGERSGSWGTLVRDGVGKIGVKGMGMEIPLPRRELGKMMNTPITIRVRARTSRKIVREFTVCADLVFQPTGNGYRLINTLDNFLRAILSTQ